ncbi:MAG: response regulator [Methyloversatilis discipulorum]|uniref:ATP-binding protein n=1 Tax=Methyloversatilis discipulorum TaxID=1119528 RepID=UPI0026EEB915|nr:ATP-binding protein [Methyloversatilis discipulorum]MBV5284772.1 response regulator [Methyloversatilis discipulorum]
MTMRAFSRMSFRWKAILGIALIEALTLSVTIFGALGQMASSQADLIQRSAQMAMSLFSAAVSDALIASDLAKVEAVSSDLVSRREAVFVRVLDQDGREVAAKGDAAALARTFRADSDPLAEGSDSFAVSAPIMAGSARIGEVQLGIDNRQARSELAQAKRLAAVVAVVGMGLAALFSWLLSGWLAHGIRRLSDGAQRIASGQLDARVDESGEQELQVLAQSFNGMAVSLQQREDEREALLQRAEQAVADAREASRAKSAFLAAMSHEIRTPLNGVVGLADILADNDSPQRAREHGRQLRIAASQLRMIVNDILDFSKIEAGKLDLEHIPFAIGDLLEACHASFASQAQDKALALTFKLAPEVPPALCGDPTRLAQILNNYVSNALKFTARGRVEVEVALCERAGQRVRLRMTVRDTGRGVSPDEIDALFEPFVQADASVVRSHGGTGLGLTICKRLAEAMGGRVGGSGAPGEGATFWAEVWLEQVEDGALPTAAEQISAVSLADLRVLVVDDIAVNRTVAVHLVERAGAHAEQAVDGRQALERVCAGGIDLVLMDIQMPVMDGKTATREIVARLGAAAPPVVGLTAHAVTEERDECLALGMRAYLTKPVDAHALLGVLATTAAGRGDVLQTMAPATVEPVAEPVTDEARPALDLAAVRQQFDGDLALYGEILATTLGEVRALRDALAARVGEPAADIVRQIHALKGVCLNLGFARAGVEAARLERALRDASLSPEQLPDALRAYVVVLDEALDAAARHLAAGPAS